mgnify:CR=1 FL=1|tara:strand:+ start:191 stop:613 length:423 start_codon:yes stop_codon:yes gene_type:complete
MSEAARIGIICGSFDLIHAGYIRMFKDAKLNACDYLIVALQSDPTIDRPDKNKCVQPVEQRAEILQSINYIDDIIFYDTEDSLYRLLEKTEYHVRILGTDYSDKDYTGKNLDPTVYFHRRDHDISTSAIKDKIVQAAKAT